MIHPSSCPTPPCSSTSSPTQTSRPPCSTGLSAQSAIEVSFNRISVDGDTSTNDTVLLLASGAAAQPSAPATAAFARSPHPGLHLARPPGRRRRRRHHPRRRAPHRRREASDADALKIAKAIAHSPLVKTAWAGNDPNWGRLVAAIGYSGAAIDPNRIDILFGDLPICLNGGRAPSSTRPPPTAYIQQPEFTITIELHQGSGACVFWTTDLTVEYIHINADYSS
jgi:glutamate N-acetyltransferase/amino-acid N-acetyltransferase